MQSHSEQPKVLAATPRTEVARDSLVAGAMPSDDDGQRYWLPHPAQKLRGDFLVAVEVPSKGGRQDEVPPRPAQKSRRDFFVAG